MWSAVSQLVGGVWAILTCPGHPPVRFPPLVNPVPAYDARLLPVLARDVALAMTGFHFVNRIPDYLPGRTSAAHAVCSVPSFLPEDGVISPDVALELAVPIAPFDVHTDGVYSFATYFRGFPRANKGDDEACAALTCHDAGACALATLLTVAPLDLRDIYERVVLAEAAQRANRTGDETCAALTCDEAGACALATLLTVAPLDLRDISESVVLAEAGQAALDMLRKTADFQRAFREWEGTMTCHVVDLADGDEHIDPHTVYTFFWVKRVMSSAGALAHYMLEHVGAFVASVVQRLSAIYSSAIYSSTRLSRCFGSMAVVSPSDFDISWISAYDLLVGILLIDVVVRASKCCWRSLGGGGGKTAVGASEWAKFRTDAEARMTAENLADVASVHSIFERGFNAHAHATKKMNKALKNQKAELVKSFAKQMEALEHQHNAELGIFVRAGQVSAGLARTQGEARLQQAIREFWASMARQATGGEEQTPRKRKKGATRSGLGRGARIPPQDGKSLGGK